VKKKEDISKIDQKVWDEYLKNPRDLHDKDYNKKRKKKNYNKKRYRFDLHGYNLAEANKKVKEIITNCLNQNYKEILLITGKGLHSNSDQNTYVSKHLSKLRYSIPEFLNSEKEISKKIFSIKTANKNEGGEGALIIKLKRL